MTDTTNTAPWAGIKLTPEQLKDILEKHAKWLRDEEGGERANLRGANLRGADLWYADLRYANLRYANLRKANLRGADLRNTDLEGADLAHTDLQDANLQGANLRGADLRNSDLLDANLRYADLRCANLWGADLRCFGNMREIRTMQIDKWGIGYTADTLQIGCQRHPIDKWRKWNTEAGRKWIAKMDPEALQWADRNLGLILQIIDANPAMPTGHEEKDHTND